MEYLIHILFCEISAKRFGRSQFLPYFWSKLLCESTAGSPLLRKAMERNTPHVAMAIHTPIRTFAAVDSIGNA